MTRKSVVVALSTKVPATENIIERRSQLREATIQARARLVKWISDLDSGFLSERDVSPSTDLAPASPVLVINSTEHVCNLLLSKANRPVEVESAEEPFEVHLIK